MNDVCKRFDSSGHDQRSPHKSRSDKFITSRFIEGLKRSIKANPIKSFLHSAKKRLVSEITIHRGILYIDKLLLLPKGFPKYLNPLIQNELISVVHVKQLGLKSYAQGKRHLLTAKMKEVRLLRCKKFLNCLTGNDLTVTFFSDEKTFMVDISFNPYQYAKIYIRRGAIDYIL